MTWPLQVAIEHALQVLTWHENLEKEEVPPEHLWEDAEGLELWWKSVEAKRSDGRSDSDYTSRDRIAVPDGDDDDRDGGMAENSLAQSLKRQ